jgi:hypothetical protein
VPRKALGCLLVSSPKSRDSKQIIISPKNSVTTKFMKSIAYCISLLGAVFFFNNFFGEVSPKREIDFFNFQFLGTEVVLEVFK